MKRLILTGTLALASGLPMLHAQQPAAPQGQQMIQGTKSVGESQAVMALFQSQNNPDGTIKAADELLTKYPETTFKEPALLQEAIAYQQKNDATKAQIYGEKVLELNPKSFQAQLMVGELIVSHVGEHDLDKEEKLAKSEKYINGAIDGIKSAPKPSPQMPDAQWEETKKWMNAEAHNDLGMIAFSRKKNDVAITEFRTAIEADPQPAYQVRLASVLQAAGKNEEAIAICDKLIADPQMFPQIKQVAQNVKAAASQGKK